MGDTGWAPVGHRLGIKLGIRLGTGWASSWAQVGYQVRHRLGTGWAQFGNSLGMSLGMSLGTGWAQVGHSVVYVVRAASRPVLVRSQSPAGRRFSRAYSLNSQAPSHTHVSLVSLGNYPLIT